jgi:hypothetical protein
VATLELEMTESMITADVKQRIATLRAMRAMFLVHSLNLTAFLEAA